MHFEFGLCSSLLLIFFVHGLVYAILLFQKGITKNSIANKWLSSFLLLCVMHISPWMLGFAGWYDTQPYRDILFYIPMQQLFFIGPVIYFYVQSLLNPSFLFLKKQWLHFLPGILYLIYSLMIFVVDKLYLHKYYFLANGVDKDFDVWYQYTGLASMLVYFIISNRYYNLYKRLMQQVISYADTVMFAWVRNFLMAFLIMQLTQISFFLLGKIYPFLETYTGNWWYFLLFAIIFYYIAITGYSNSVIAKVPFKLNKLNYAKPLLLIQESSPATIVQVDDIVEDAEYIETEPFGSTKQIDNTLLTEWKPKILSLIEQDRVYENPELSLAQIAKLLNTNASVISKVINQGFKMNFNDFINFYRVQAVKQKLNAGEQKLQTLLGIAYDCGFNSKATFNRAFKKFTVVSPKNWVGKL